MQGLGGRRRKIYSKGSTLGRGTVPSGSEAKDSRKGKATDKCVGVGGVK